MKERSILFSGEMVRAIIAGRKTQTRRVVKFREVPNEPEHHNPWHTAGGWQDGDESLRCPYGAPGDRLWVREGWSAPITVLGAVNWLRMGSGEKPVYRADGGALPSGYGAWRSPLFMPRWASRIALRVTGVRVERLWDITEADALAEGVEPDPLGRWYGSGYNTAVYAYEAEWDRINGKRAPWASNPWVWVVEFRRVQP